jgi:hypothetical protein
VAWIFANNHDPSVAANHFALFTHWFDTRSYLHRRTFIEGHLQEVLAGATDHLGRSARAIGLPLLVAVGDSTSGEIVGSEFDLDSVAGKDADVVSAHLARDMPENSMAILELDPEHGVRQGLGNGAFKHDRVFLGLRQNIPPRRTGGTDVINWTNGQNCVETNFLTNLAKQSPPSTTTSS